MLALAFTLLAAAPDDSMLRHLAAVASAQAPAPSPDGVRLAFVTTLFGSRQVATMDVNGSYPVQLTDEPSGVVAVRYSPTDPKMLIAVALRDGHERLVFLDEEGNPPKDVDPAPGDQLIGGFTRDGRKLLYATLDGKKVGLFTLALGATKPVPVQPPPPAAGLVQPAGTHPVDELLQGLIALSPPSPDGRSALAVVHGDEGDALILVDLAMGRGETLAKADRKARYRVPRFSPDMKTVYVLTDAGRATMGVDSIALQGRARKTVFTARGDVEAYALSEDGHRLAVAVEQQGETLFSLLDYPSMRAQPLPQPPAGALAPGHSGEPGLSWNKQGDRLFFGWRLADDTTDVWSFRMGYGTPQRHTRSPRPGIPRGALARPQVITGTSSTGAELEGWLWMPEGVDKPRVAVLASSALVRPVFDKRIAALNAAGLAVVAFNGKEAQATALRYVKSDKALDPSQPVLLLLDDAHVEEPAQWGGIVAPKGQKAGLELDPHSPDLAALAKYARKP